MTRRLSKGQAARLAVLLGFTGTLGSSLALAATPPDAGQTLQQLQPTLPPAAPSAPAPQLQNPAAPATPAAPTVADTTPIPVQQVTITGNTAIPTAELQALVADLPGHSPTLAELRTAAARITAYYRDRGYLLARAYLPPQELRNGQLTIAVLEGRVEKVALDNRSAVDSSRLQALLAARLPAGQPINGQAANRALLLLQQTPGIGAVQGSLQPGSAVGSTDVTVAVAPQPRVSGNLGLDNAGNRYTGRDRLLGDVAVNNLAGIGDQLRLQGVVSEHDDLDYGRLAWDAPVGSNGLRLGAAFSNTRYELGGVFSSLDAHGTARTVSVYGSYPLWLAPANRGSLGLALERRDLRDTQNSIGFDNRKMARAAVLTLEGSFLDTALGSPASNAWRLANTFGSLDLRSPGAAAIDTVTARTAGDYDKAVLSLSREQQLPAKFSFYLAGTLQRSSKNLDSSEQFVLGGPNGVRAYPTGEAVGDQGWLATAELRYRVCSGLQLALFEDAGGIDINRNPYIVQANGRHLQGGGIAATAVWRSFSVKASAAWRGDEAPTSDSDRQPRVWVAGSYAF